MTAISIESLIHTWPGQSHATLDIKELNINAGDTFFIHGASGSGKSTLLNILAGVLSIQSGKLKVLGQNFATMSHAQRDKFRADNIGYIFQQFNLLPYLTVMENVTLPCHASKQRERNAIEQYGSVEEAAHYGLTSLNIPKALFHTSVMRLSVGQQQRVAAARALIGNPSIIIADEPTSALDHDNIQNFMETLKQKCSEINSTLVFVSHDRTLAEFFGQSMTLPSRLQEAEQ